MQVLKFLIIIILFGQSNGALNALFQRCCFVGTQWGESEESCDRYPPPVAGIATEDQQSCLAVIEVCCLKKFQLQKCEKGKNDAMDNQTCIIRSDETGSEQYKECCLCCKLGRIARSMSMPCILGDIGIPCERVFQECCDGGTNKNSNITIDGSIDECAKFPGQLCDQQCIDTRNSFRCACNVGFVLQADGKSCRLANDGEDYDQCRRNNPCEQTCQHDGLRFICDCTQGYRLNRDRKTCSDVDECRDGSASCHVRQVCVNAPGTYKCQAPPRCPNGYRFNPQKRRCEPEYRCPVGSVYNPTNRRCERPPTRECQSGFGYNTVTQTCEDIDECVVGNDNCNAPNQICRNTVGDFVCQCSVGYQYNAYQRVCEDINECTQNFDICQQGQRCENNAGSYVCRRVTGCGTGYTLESRTQQCIDDNECLLGIAQCSLGYECHNTKGSFRCSPKTCGDGYRFNRELGDCERLMCTAGMRIRAGRCVDIDECAERPGICARHQQCINNRGSYQCRNLINCGDGYELDPSGVHCRDVDECQKRTHNCHASMVCRNRPGTFYCECQQGYRRGAGGQCEDINECSRSVCSRSAECQNLAGSYRCVCKQGFRDIGDGSNCIDVDECQQENSCEFQCRNTYGSYSCICGTGYELSPNKRSCRDVDECSKFTGRGRICGGNCENTPGSYRCTCPTGYNIWKDRWSCEDVDECSAGTARCTSPNAICFNTRGSYKCPDIVCPRGFTRTAFTGNNKQSVSCRRETLICPPRDQECLNAPISLSHHFLTFPSQIKIPATLFNMRAKKSVYSRADFDLSLVSARPVRAGVEPITRSFFRLNQEDSSGQVVVLNRIPGPQDVELELRMTLYNQQNQFLGEAVSKLYIYVTDLDTL